MQSSRSAGSAWSAVTDAPDRRSDSPNGASGETRAFTAGTWVVRLSRISVQVSPGCTSVEYVRWPRRSLICMQRW